MKKSVINQVEKVLRKRTSCWSDVSIEKKETDEWAMFLIRCEDGFCSSPVVEAVFEVSDSFGMVYQDAGIYACIDAEMRDGLPRPVINLNVRITQ
jgi:hypothetical protein